MRAWISAAVVLVTALGAAPAAGDTRVPVRVEREKPSKPKKPTLRFLKENVSFIRGRLDALRVEPRSGDGTADALDARALVYETLLAESRAAREEITERIDLDGDALLASVAELARLEEELDAMERSLGDQAVRLAALDQDFDLAQETAVIVVVSGLPEAGVARIVLTDEEGNAAASELGEAERNALQRGGLAELQHVLVEPREQVWSIAVERQGEERGPAVHVTFRPQRNHLCFLELDLSELAPGAGAEGLEATLLVRGKRASTDDWRWASR